MFAEKLGTPAINLQLFYKQQRISGAASPRDIPMDPAHLVIGVQSRRNLAPARSLQSKRMAMMRVTDVVDMSEERLRSLVQSGTSR